MKHAMPRIPSAFLQAEKPASVVGAVRQETGDDFRQLLQQTNAEFDRIGSRLQDRLEVLETRNHDLEQKMASRSWGGGDASPASWGGTVVNSADYQSFVTGGCRGRTAVSVQQALTTADGAGALITPDRDPEGVLLPRRRLTIRSLLGPGRTGSSSVEYFRETTFTNNADVVSEGAEKPQSVLDYALETTPVRTIAHWIPASRQAMEDAAQLGSLIDGSLRYGLAYREEVQFLYGDGIGQNLHGIVPQATEFDDNRVSSGDTDLDIIRHAISQAEEADLPATGIILNTRDWMDLAGIKDNEGRYIGPGPYGTTVATLWRLPVVWTNAIAVGEFVVGAFATATQIYDRMDPEVVVSSEDRDNFIKNMLTVRAEERLAFAVKRPAALITGTLSSYSSGS